MATHDLERFVTAQGPVMDRVIEELQGGRKRGHWMWFVFPQIAGLGRSATARKFAIADLQEAEHYLKHPVLGLRLRECTCLVMAVERRPLEAILGGVDALKFRSCMTLFGRVPDAGTVFNDALEELCGGLEDPTTVVLVEENVRQQSVRR